MATPFPVGPLSPYVTPQLLTQASTGVSWSSIPAGTGVTPAQRLAEQANICARATALVDKCCKQPLRATVDLLPLYGPGVRVGVDRGGCKPTRLIMKRWPVLEVLSIQVSPNTFPQAWTPVPAGSWSVASPVTGLYDSVAPPSAGEGGQAVLLKPGYVDWRRGRDGYVVETSYVNGWPHAGITAAVAAGATSLVVDDCTGWAASSPWSGFTGATGTVYDAGAQEVIHVTAASATQGPGTLTLSSPLLYPHPAGVLVSTLPETVVWAAILFGAAQALTRGATATTVREIPGKSSQSAGGIRAATFTQQAEAILCTFRRII